MYSICIPEILVPLHLPYKQHLPRSLGGTVPGAHHSLAGREAEGDDDSVGAPVWCSAAAWSI